MHAEGKCITHSLLLPQTAPHLASRAKGMPSSQTNMHCTVHLVSRAVLIIALLPPKTLLPRAAEPNREIPLPQAFQLRTTSP